MDLQSVRWLRDSAAHKESGFSSSCAQIEVVIVLVFAGVILEDLTPPPVRIMISQASLATEVCGSIASVTTCSHHTRPCSQSLLSVHVHLYVCLMFTDPASWGKAA